MRDPSWLKDPLWRAKEHMRSVAHVLRTRRGSGAVIVASRVNFVVSRKSGGAVRAPGNTGDKRVKRKRGTTGTRKRKIRTASAEHDRHTRTARTGRSGRHTRDC